jgi:hypothetical protein
MASWIFVFNFSDALVPLGFISIQESITSDFLGDVERSVFWSARD